MSRLIRDTAGMTLGYITHGTRGIRQYYKASKLLGKRKRSGGNRSTGFGGSKRRIIGSRRRTRFKGRLTVKRTATSMSRKLSQTVSDIAKRVINKDTPTGRYYRIWGGKASGLPTTSNIQQYSKNVDQSLTYTGGAAINSLTFFSVPRLVDIVSTLFNNKVKTLLQTPSVDDFQDINLKFMIQYAKATTSFKNGSTVALEVEVFDVQHKYGTDDQVLTVFGEAYNSSNLIQVGGSTETRNNMAMKPFTLPLMMKSYKHTSVKKVLQPGESMYYTCTLPVNFMFDKSKYGEGAGAYEYQPFTHELLYNFKPVTTWGVVTATGEGFTGHYWPGNTASTNANAGLIIEVKETYVVDCPKDTDHLYKNDNYCFFSGYPLYATFAPDKITNVAGRDHLVTTATGFE